MPTLKQLVDGAIKAGSCFSIPKHWGTQIEVPSNSWSFRFVPPSDGWLHIQAYQSINIFVGCDDRQSGISTYNVAPFATAAIPVRKGTTCLLYQYVNTSGSYKAFFFPLFSSP